ncbi:MAG TPA: ribosomal protein S18-alanine N-acetyltransferase [Anaerolineales bacterium]|nr:ribosomal protein S18-alanine N-acetyltransferase [Anaerolineales bacterium]
MNLTIRRMTEADLAAVHEIDHLSFALPWPERSFRFEINANPSARCWVGELDGRVVALMVIWMIVDEAHIATFATHPDFRRQGFGRQLLKHGLEAAAREGAETAFLEVRASNEAAQKLYREFGFVEDGRRARYYKDNSEDAILMSLNSLEAFARH